MAANSKRYSSTTSLPIVFDAYLGGGKLNIIPIEICYAEQTIKALEKIKSSSILVLFPNHAISSARFIVEQLHKWMKCKDANISWMPVDEVADFKHLLKDSHYDRILVSPGARSKVPVKLHQSSRILLLQMELDPEGSGNRQNQRWRDRMKIQIKTKLVPHRQWASPNPRTR